MVALHAWRSAESIRVFRELYPDCPLIVGLSGTDIYDYIDAANIDLKAFTENFYGKTTLTHLQPVLDTLFTSENVVGPTGVLVKANDTQVTEVHARKTQASVREEEGADIIVTWED